MDFAALVLSTCMVAFSDAIVFTPSVSQPGVAAYPARGVYASKVVQIQGANGGVFSDVQPTLGVKLDDFAAEPEQGDSFVRSGVTWFVWDVQPDGQGGADLTIKQVSPL